MESTKQTGSPRALNDLPTVTAVAELRACCAAPGWAEKLAVRRPYADLDELLAAADQELDELDWSEVETALAAHPRIGDRPEGADRESAWSRREQSAAGEAPESVRAKLTELTREYERRFDRVFLICADGLSAERILANLTTRLDNAEHTERAIIRDELRKIVRLRLSRWLA